MLFSKHVILGVGWSTGKRLEAEGLTTCGDLQKCSLGQLQSLLGPRTGQSLYNYCRGVDTRVLKSEHVVRCCYINSHNIIEAY